jgi:hypothetical protein
VELSYLVASPTGCREVCAIITRLQPLSVGRSSRLLSQAGVWHGCASCADVMASAFTFHLSFHSHFTMTASSFAHKHRSCMAPEHRTIISIKALSSVPFQLLSLHCNFVAIQDFYFILLGLCTLQLSASESDPHILSVRRAIGLTATSLAH